MSKLFHYRKEYKQSKLDLEALHADPVEQFNSWFNQAENFGIGEPNVMVLSTTGKDLHPSSRIVLLKECSDKGFSFFTNYNSKKGQQIIENPHASLLFPWHDMERQVRIEGKIEKLPEEISDVYFQGRPAGSRFAAWASPQSSEIHSREVLDNKIQELEIKYLGEMIPRPPHWGGYLLIPELFEFWQGRENRLHDRFEYKRENNVWKIKRLAP